MNNFKNIQKKLHQFITKFYINELIKGVILFFAIGLLYFIFTLFIEYFLWLNPFYRTILFCLFILVESSLLIFYILIPIFKILGFKKGITQFEASKIIGKHFPNVEDKLLNILQLNANNNSSELIEASIHQKSKQLQPIPFVRAVDFKKNKKYLKYLLIPFLVWFLVFITGNISIFNESFSRVVHYNKAYEPPAPFYFKILNKNLQVIEGQDIIIKIETIGSVFPEDAKINFLNENYYLIDKGFGNFEYKFTNVKENIVFELLSNSVVSKQYEINTIKTPVITNLKMRLQYPSYIGKQNEIINNTGNAIVPQGTIINWDIKAHQTDTVNFKSFNNAVQKFNKVSNSTFVLSKKINNSVDYKISTSNKNLTNHESLNFSIEVITDEYPKIIVKSDIDSITHGPAQFIGQISDDYNVNKLQLVYYNKQKPKEFKTLQIPISSAAFVDFYYVFPTNISIEEGVNYEMFFEVYDNDAVNGSKKSKSKVFSYYNKTNNELKEELLKEQNETIESISKNIQKSKKETLEIEKFNNELQKKSSTNWNDSKKLQDFVKRQEAYEKLFQEKTDELEQNLNDQPEIKSLSDKKEELEKRIQEAKALTKKDKILEELKELSKKLNEENLVDKLKELTKKNKQKEQSLERILELTKRFYVEQKMNQLKDNLKVLGEEQEKLSNKIDKENTAAEQEKINSEFNKIKNDFKELENDNKKLNRPINIPIDLDEQNKIDNDLKNALDNLNESKKEIAKKSQKLASKKMKKMSESMEKSMSDSEGESIDENIDELRKIVENLIEFSFKQENLMNDFSNSSNDHPEFPAHLKQQHVLKEYFSHIDDSLYVLSLRLVKMGSSIQKEVSDAHYYIDNSLENFADNKIDEGISDQQFVITAANNLANSLSNILESLMNASLSFGKGKGNSQEFSLPDIIQKQGKLSDKIKEGNKKGKKPNSNSPGNNGEHGEQMNSDLYEIYKQQVVLKEALNKILNNQKANSFKDGLNDVIKKMEELENEILNKGLNESVLNKMEQLKHQLLKLDVAKLEQGEDEKRKSNTNIIDYNKRNINKIKLQNQYFNYNEILNRQSLPLRTIYKKKVQEYFNTED